MHARAIEPASTQIYEVRNLHRIEWFKRRVWRRCRELGLSITDLGTRIGVTHTWISRLLRHERMDRVQFERLCKALEVDDFEWWMQPVGRQAMEGFSLVDFEKALKAEAARIAREQEGKGRR